MTSLLTRKAINGEETLKKSRVRMIKFAIEMIVYAALVLGYFYFVLEFLGDPLKKLFVANLNVYALIALALVVLQGIALEIVTSLIMRLLGLSRLN
jgi:hypothetical protein